MVLKVLRYSQRHWASTPWPGGASGEAGRGAWALDPDGPRFLILDFAQVNCKIRVNCGGSLRLGFLIRTHGDATPVT